MGEEGVGGKEGVEEVGRVAGRWGVYLAWPVGVAAEVLLERDISWEALGRPGGGRGE